ncbi:MAG: ABC transporter ATP-binding protein [Bacteroidetes bacterium]|nr:ABC transporter ATP-binding protein [Bacteroidota bacterium]
MASKLSSLKSLNKYLWRYRGRLLAGVVFVIISNFFAIVPAQVFRHAFDKVGATLKYYELHKTASLDRIMSGELAHSLIRYTFIIIGMAILRGIFMFLMRQTIIVISRKVEYDLKNDLYNQFQKLSLSYYRNHNTGDLMARISEDVGRVRMYVGPAIMYGVNMITTIVLVVAIMLSVNPRLTFYVMLPMPILAFMVYYVNNIIFKRSNQLQEQLSSITTFTQEVFSGIRVIKTFAAEEAIKNHFNEESNAYRGRSLSLARIDALFFPLIALLMGVGILMTLYIGGNETIRGTMTAGNIAEFFIYITLLAWPVTAVGFVTSLIQRAAVSQKRINDIMHVQPDIVSTNHQSEKVVGNINLKDVNFTYPETGIHALKNINLNIKAGDSLGVIGKTGSGKSSLAYLLTRAYDVDNGEVIIDNKNIKDINLGSYLSQTGYVPQDNFLFSDSIRENILFGNPTPYESLNSAEKIELDKRVIDAATMADVHKDIIQFPKGYDTMIGERGITLSGGQKQRLTLARAIINNPSILILDDCFSAIDNATESQILQNLSVVMRNKTSVIISHRVSTVKNCTHIIVLKDGNISEEGKHDDLLTQGGYYYGLFRKQLMEKEIYEEEKSPE